MVQRLLLLLLLFWGSIVFGTQNPIESKIWFDKGICYQQHHAFDLAVQSYKQAIVDDEQNLAAYDNVGACFELMKKQDEALREYLEAMYRNPNFIEVRTNENKNMPPLSNDDIKKLDGAMPWGGESLAGKKIFVYAEKGIGDTIQFVRFLPMLKKQKCEIYFKPQAAIAPFLARNFAAVVHVFDKSVAIDDLRVDYYVSLLSLPYLLKIQRCDQVDVGPSYFTALPEKVDVLKKTFFDNKMLKIGIVWQGDPKHPNDKNRSVSLSFFYPLTRIPGVKIYSLQKWYEVEQLKQVPAGVEIVNLDPVIKNFEDTAALMKNLDLLIAIDTTVAHLGGALGVKTWLLLPYVTDWRWMGYGTDVSTIWYRSMKKYLQDEVGVWNPVFDAVVNDVKALIGSAV